ncbi:concanavalin A-like lectin/glucanase domain-containing protein, partial [Polychytrium aggregatum]|uniref:concanavalin A-like lectin/glucanase domain-containing protein n=1 Tax=Polychytrium aggregatum TaxID=110093 RepID=UPI0022FE5B67
GNLAASLVARPFPPCRSCPGSEHLPQRIIRLSSSVPTMQLLSLTALVAAAFMARTASAGTPSTDGNCVSGHYTFTNSSRIYFNPIPGDHSSNGPFPEAQAQRNLYDFTLDNGVENASFGPEGLNVTLTRYTLPNGTNWAWGAQLSSNFYIKYGKITTRFSAPPIPGLVTTFFTMSDVKDEIDVEIVGIEQTDMQSNIFYKGIEEFGPHMQRLTIPDGGNIGGLHDYTVDWNSQRIIFSIDGVPLRTTFKNDSFSATNATTDPWFPNTPSFVRLTAWDAGDFWRNGTAQWAGGPTTWNAPSYSAIFAYIDIQCYDDNDQPVAAWPPQALASLSAHPSGTATTSGAGATGSPQSTSSASTLLKSAIVPLAAAAISAVGMMAWL